MTPISICRLLVMLFWEYFPTTKASNTQIFWSTFLNYSRVTAQITKKLELRITNLIWYSRPEFLPVSSGTSLSYPEFQASDFSSGGMCSLLHHSVFSIDPPFLPSWPQAQVEAVQAAAVDYCFRSYFVCIGDKFWTVFTGQASHPLYEILFQILNY